MKPNTVQTKNLLQSAKHLRLQRRFMFQQDNDPKHTARATLEWLQNKNVKVLEYPSQNPDLNPIENLWKDLKIAVQLTISIVHRKDRCSQFNLAELEQICKDEWEKIPKSRCEKLIQTNPRRLEAVITAKGASKKC